MLVLSRKPGETIVIKVAGIEIVIVPTKIITNRVHIGIQAPAEASIRRGELEERKVA